MTQHTNSERTQRSVNVVSGLQRGEPFLNPYNFVDVSGYTPRYPAVSHDRYLPFRHSGRVEVELEFQTPFFIPDSSRTEFIINDATLKVEDDEGNVDPRVSQTIKAFFKKMGTGGEEMEIIFNETLNSVALFKNNYSVKVNTSSIKLFKSFVIG
jgi:hypothetical protein